MLWSKGNNSKNYNVIIIPERGGRSRTINLSVILLKAFIILFLITAAALIILVKLFFYKYSALSEDASALKDTKTYIRFLEEDNKEKQKQLEDYKSVESKINDKLKELQKLQETIQEKLDKSISLSGTSSGKINYAITEPVIYELTDGMLKELDNKIQSFDSMNRELDDMINEEKFIPDGKPCEGTVSSNFGYRANPFNLRSGDFHPGIDIANSYGTEIHAAGKGTVSFSGYYSGYGYAVIIRHHNGLESLYGHTSKIYVAQGQEVEKGQLIALIGSSGNSTGPHLHFEIRKNESPINPMEFLKGGI